MFAGNGKVDAANGLLEGTESLVALTRDEQIGLRATGTPNSRLCLRHAMPTTLDN
jgi:hypothetical protein